MEKGNTSGKFLSLVTDKNNHAVHRWVAHHNLSNLFQDPQKQQEYEGELKSIKKYVHNDTGRTVYYKDDKTKKPSTLLGAVEYKLHPSEIAYRAKLLGYDHPVSREEYLAREYKPYETESYNGGVGGRSSSPRHGQKEHAEYYKTEGYDKIIRRHTDLGNSHIDLGTKQADKIREERAGERMKHVRESTIASAKRKLSEINSDTNKESLLSKLKFVNNRLNPISETPTKVMVDRNGKKTEISLHAMIQALEKNELHGSEKIGVNKVEIV